MKDSKWMGPRAPAPTGNPRSSSCWHTWRELVTAGQLALYRRELAFMSLVSGAYYVHRPHDGRALSQRFFLRRQLRQTLEDLAAACCWGEEAADILGGG